jgi:probable phosphoglycerate mutase
VVSKVIQPIIFVRHGETDWNKQGRIQGSIDTELNDTGRAQAQAVALALLAKREELMAYDFIVSPQKRAQDTMAAINAWQERQADQIRAEPLVREIDFGIWEGKTWAEVIASGVYPADPAQRFFWRPEGGESYQDGTARAQALLDKITRPTLIVAHGGIGRCLMALIAHKSPAEAISLPIPQGVYCRLQDETLTWFDANNLPA